MVRLVFKSLGVVAWFSEDHRMSERRRERVELEELERVLARGVSGRRDKVTIFAFLLSVASSAEQTSLSAPKLVEAAG
jgi:hypothetical protein